MKIHVQAFTSRDLIVSNWNDSLEDAYSVMRTKGVRHLPVVDDGGYIVGLISDRDMQRAMQVDHSDFHSGYPTRAAFDPQSTVRDFMSWPVEAIEESVLLGEAAKRMLDSKISALLVTSRGDVVGIVTTEDMLRALVAELESSVDRVKQNVEGMVYNSSVGELAQAIANAGI
jgi:acetoin utilization protein AcuB